VQRLAAFAVVVHEVVVPGEEDPGAEEEDAGESNGEGDADRRQDAAPGQDERGQQDGFVDNYGKGGKPLHLELTGKVLAITAREASYDALYLPWLAALGPLPFGRHARRALLPLLTGLGVIAYTLFFYLHEPDPSWWIASSAARVLLTALMAFVVASAAASE